MASGLDPSSWAHLPAPAHAAAGHRRSASLEDQSPTRASVTPAAAAAASWSSYPTTPSSSDLGHAAPALTGPRAGRVAKRKPRPSRRPPPTYIAADPASFRRMVQEVTGFPVAPTAAGGREPGWPKPPPPARVLPTLDTSAFLLGPRGADAKSSTGSGASPSSVAVAVEDDGSSVPRLPLALRLCDRNDGGQFQLPSVNVCGASGSRVSDECPTGTAVVESAAPRAGLTSLHAYQAYLGSAVATAAWPLCRPRVLPYR